jgi:hypothetical protein
MKDTLKTVAVVAVLAGVLGVAVRSAAASIETASNTASLVDSQRRITVSVTPLIANNDINLGQPNKAVEVAILGETSLDFSEIDPQTVEFAKAIPARSSYKSTDVNNDGVPDRTYSFTTKMLKLTPADTIACLELQTMQKLKMSGCDKVKVIPAKLPNNW